MTVGEIDNAMRRRGLHEVPRDLIRKRLVAIAQAAQQRSISHVKQKAQQDSHDVVNKSHSHLSELVTYLKERDVRLDGIESKLNALLDAGGHVTKAVNSSSISSSSAVVVKVNGGEEKELRTLISPPVAAASKATITSSSSSSSSEWNTHIEPETGRHYYAKDDGSGVRWEPPADHVDCPFDGGQWIYLDPLTGTPSGPPHTLSSLWKKAADGAIADTVRVGIFGAQHVWPFKSIMRRAITVSHLFHKCCQDIGVSDTGDCDIPIDTFTPWMTTAAGDAIDADGKSLLNVMRSIDTDGNNGISRIEFMIFLLEHHETSRSLVAWIDQNW
jgi:hypothetical protein